MAANGELVIAVGQELDYREDLIEEMIFWANVDLVCQFAYFDHCFRMVDS